MHETPSQTHTPRVAIVGAGPAGLAAAEILAERGVAVTLYERMPSPARKFLMAGRGGLNLTHSEALEPFLARYGAARPHIDRAIRAFPPDALRAWCEEFGIETFVGSSGRVFPRTMKASPLLRAWLARLASHGVILRTRWLWRGWDAEGALLFDTPDGARREVPATVILALGGASWPRLGSDGSWTTALAARSVALSPLRPANCSFRVGWSEMFRERFAGRPLKTARFTFGDASVRGEAMISADGVEGGAIYALSAALRDAIDQDGEAELEIDLRPDETVAALAARLASQSSGGASMSNRLRRIGLSDVASSLLRERAGGPGLPGDPSELARTIKRLRIRMTGAGSIARAISTAGGVAWESMASDFSLHAAPDVFVCGEMIDWEAPTGGYLLQGCIATGRAAGLGALERLRRPQDNSATDI